MMDVSIDFWLLFICVAGYLTSRIEDRLLRWRVFGVLQFVSMGIWLIQYVLLQIYGTLW
jgi:hypothetical protein